MTNKERAVRAAERLTNAAAGVDGPELAAAISEAIGVLAVLGAGGNAVTCAQLQLQPGAAVEYTTLAGKTYVTRVESAPHRVDGVWLISLTAFGLLVPLHRVHCV